MAFEVLLALWEHWVETDYVGVDFLLGCYSGHYLGLDLGFGFDFDFDSDLLLDCLDWSSFYD